MHSLRGRTVRPQQSAFLPLPVGVDLFRRRDAGGQSMPPVRDNHHTAAPRRSDGNGT